MFRVQDVAPRLRGSLLQLAVSIMDRGQGAARNCASGPQVTLEFSKEPKNLEGSVLTMNLPHNPNAEMPEIGRINESSTQFTDSINRQVRDWAQTHPNLLPAGVEVPGTGFFTVHWDGNSSLAGSRLSGRVAGVTGAAQGFGLGISEELLKLGATVFLMDMNIDLAREKAAELTAIHGQGRARAIEINVCDPQSCQEAALEVARVAGGLDLFISNAGVLRAGSVLDQPVADFDLVTNVNYRGFFLTVQAFAPLLCAQTQAFPERWLDIVEVNSKSGLEGSKRNFAYAGSKFGGIGLTQSFALELVDYGVKVNAVCPGNFLDGPLWTDPDRGLFVQYLNAGKVPGATSVDDVRRFYEGKVPMGRGCLPSDVARAIVYTVEQAYETGQALPVTGGQNMLN